MLTKLTIRNFKRFDEVEIELGNPVVFIGPNNSGKTSAMQALALWDVGLKRWNEKRSGKPAPKKRSGVTINRRDILAVPVPSAALLWRSLHMRNVRKVEGRQRTDNVRIDVIVEGIVAGAEWTCGLEFDYANEESFYCRPLGISEAKQPARMPVPAEAGSVRTAFLPPMSGLAATETRLDHGAVNVRVGEGRTAEVLRNLCFRVLEKDRNQWKVLVGQIKSLFGAALDAPRYVQERGEITMCYQEGGVTLDISSSGRGLQQTLLLLAYMYANPGAVVLLDEPDAHLEMLRQRQIYKLLTDTASESGSQVIAASHSEVLLNEAAERDMVIAFVGQPHRLEGSTSQVRKALSSIGFDQYSQGKQTGWVLYLEGPTDLAILQAFAKRLGHDKAVRALERPFVHYVGNQPNKAQEHYFGLRETLPKVLGVVLFDRLDGEVLEHPPLRLLFWRRREIENYFCTQATLEAYARASAPEDQPMPLFTHVEIKKRLGAMREAMTEVEKAMETLGKGSPWDTSAKVSDEFLTPLFHAYFQKLNLENLMSKRSFYALADYVPEEEIDPEIREKLDKIVAVAERATRGIEYSS